MTAIDDKWRTLPWMGAPVDKGAGSGEMATPDARGRTRDFLNGSIYWTPVYGAFEVHGAAPAPCLQESTGRAPASVLITATTLARLVGYTAPSGGEGDDMPVSFEIHPSLGISRVGTSEQFFFGPEPGVAPPTRYRDEGGKLLRQAARFRVFECQRDDEGRLVRASEVGPDRGRITWTVHVANRKGDSELSPPPASRRPQPGARRNAGHDDRADLVIDPGPRMLEGPGMAATFDDGQFLSVTVPLGEARTDDDARLVFVGGFGRSEGPAEDLRDFSNNDNWFDDVCDGPVTASVELPGREPVQAAPAWLVVAPPDFAPQITNFVTLFDVAFQAAVERGWLTVPETPSFTRHILPILSRAVGYAWVIQLAQDGHGEGRRGAFTEVSRLARFADPTLPKAVRRTVVERLRDPNDLEAKVPDGSMPRLHDETHSADVLASTKSQYAVLRSWVAGTFVNDLEQPFAPEPLPDALDRAALEACAGGPFFPGIEVGRIMGEPTRYASPFRLDATQHRPGDVTQGNAVPWQADFLLCRYGEHHHQLGWWPAQRPDKIFVDIASPRVERWQRGVEKFADMVDHWHELGVVVPARDPDGKLVFVESERLLPGN